jgi:exosortase B
MTTSVLLANRNRISGISRLQDTPWVPLLAGFVAMYVPIYLSAVEGIWQTEEQGHGPIVLAVVVWLFWSLRQQIDASSAKPRPALGWSVLLLGLLLYFVGRVFDISILTFASQPFVIAGAILLTRGTSAIRVAWFPIVYLVFMIPLPGVLVDAVTGSLKGTIANIAENLLYLIGYPIARSGVILSIGPYELQVADACSGLNSMFSLSALGTLFMYLRGEKSKTHLLGMLLSILPIAFVANIVRVITLVLVTFYLGDEAGQGFLHKTAGMVLMMVALVCLFTLDRVLSRVFPSRRVVRQGGGE